METKMSRRDFLKVLGMSAAGTVLLDGLGAGTAHAETELPSFDLGPYRLTRTKETPSICCYCGCGCGLLVYSEGDRVVNLEGDPDHPINEGSMCPKGIALSDMNTIVDNKRRRVPNEKRVTQVLYRAPGSSQWVVKDWDWAFTQIAQRIKKVRDASFEEKEANGVTVNRTQALAHLGSASIDNEENYLMCKLMRAMGVINLDHHARL